MDVLRIENLTAGYRKCPVLKNLSLTVQQGEILAVMGENGSGKTTLLRAIQGSIPLQKGHVFVNETDLSTLDVRQRAALVTTMAQDTSADPGLTAMENIELGFYPHKGLFGKLNKEDCRKIESLASDFGIQSLLNRDVSQMSTGERQLVALLRAAVQETPLLMLDEPSAALDFNRTEKLFFMLNTFAEQGRSILIVLHDPTQALRNASKILKFAKSTGQQELLDLRKDSLETIENSLRDIFPDLRVHNDPLFCYLKNKTSKTSKI